jgi:membrane protease YdiL (CAAX protease family)
MSSSDRCLPPWFSLAEAFVIFFLIIEYIWSLRFRLPAFWVLILALIALSHVWRRETLPGMGFRRAGFRASLREFGPLVLAAAGSLILAGLLTGSVRSISVEAAIGSLVAYCVWGLFQQYLLNGYFVNRLRDFFGRSMRVPLVAALLFELVHLPNWFLMAVTFTAGLIGALAYLRHRNLYFLGLAHGLLGFLLYLVVPDAISRHMYVGPRWFSFH